MNDIVVEEIGSIGRILDFLHDRPLSLEDMVFNEESKELCFSVPVVTDDVVDKKKYLILSTWKHTVRASKFCLFNVESYKIQDDAQIGNAVVNTIDYKDGCVVINCCVPVTITVKVSSLNLKLTVSDEVVDTVSQFSFG